MLGVKEQALWHEKGFAEMAGASEGNLTGRSSISSGPNSARPLGSARGLQQAEWQRGEIESLTREAALPGQTAYIRSLSERLPVRVESPPYSRHPLVPKLTLNGQRDGHQAVRRAKTHLVKMPDDQSARQSDVEATAPMYVPSSSPAVAPPLTPSSWREGKRCSVCEGGLQCMLL
mmetsp:Transcript_77207/g.249845  ORF Transcript_77207/g.249845 Transcript_77207/m.249845 type:complete len:175 (+) Transcript_77207:66-590(+)